MELVPLDERPSWRGRMHLWAGIVAVPAGVVLVLLAERTAARVAAGVYALTLVLVFGTSAAHHRCVGSERTRRILQRLDHSMIYLLIAGSYVPVCIVALPPGWGISLLAVVGGLAVVGMAIKLGGFRRVQWVGYALYPVMGWALVIALPVLFDSLTTLQLALIVAGGVAYTVGMPVLLVKRPNPWPDTFGYHEVWHTFTVVAAALHFAAISDVVA